MVMINMNNPNALIALAYIKTNDNPLKVFCNYILYLLMKSPYKKLRADELKEHFRSEFGLNIPQQIIRNCGNLLKKNQDIKILSNGEGYVIDKTTFDFDKFESILSRLKNQEIEVIQSIVDFMQTRYRIEWSLEEARKNLSHFLDEEGNGARIFLSEDFLTDRSDISSSLFIGRYIAYIRENDETKKQFLEEIVNGVMIFQGIYQTNDYQQYKEQKFKGTIIFLDTKLILRAMGFTWKEYEIATQELIKLITEDCGGTIGVFPQTLNEVKNALYTADSNIKNNNPIVDYELRIWAELNPADATLLYLYSTSVERILQEKFKVKFSPIIDWNDKTTQQNVINEQMIVNFIQEKNLSWKQGAIKYDVEIIQQINILRKGDYSIQYGGRDKLPIFITSNKNLVHSFREYVESEQETNNTSIWNLHALPIISDNMLLSRLWLPRAKKYANLPTLKLAQFSYAAQMPDGDFFSKLKIVADSYKNSKCVDILNIDEERRRQLEDILIEKTHGNADDLNEEILAMSADEFAKIQNISLVKENSDLKNLNDNQEKTIERQNIKINELHASKFVNKIGLGRILIWAAKGWWVIATIIAAIILLGVDIGLSFIVSPAYLTVVIPAAVEVLLTLIDKFTDKKDLQNFLVKKAIGYEWKKYVNMIKTSLSQEYNIDINWIIDYCLEHTPLFNKYKRFCTYI